MKRKSILVINRWNDKITRYETYINHEEYNVWYLTNKKGSAAVNKGIAKLYELDEINISQIEKSAVPFLKKAHNIDTIIALSEVDQEAAAYLRSCFYIPGLKSSEILKFRNKVEMKIIAEQSNILVPRYSPLDHPKFKKFIKTTHYPLILKPKNGVSSEGVIKVNNEETLTSILKSIPNENYECEEYIDGKIFHADGLIYNQKIIFFKVSEYINTCLDYTLGKPLGSVVIDDLVFESEAKDYTLKILKAFSLNNSAFHLEFIQSKNGVIYFLELGARVGGAQVPYLFEKIFKINLIHAWIDIQLKNDITKHIKNTKNKSVGGWLLFPEPKTLPCKVLKTYSLKENVPHIIEENLPPHGHIFNGNGEYRDTCGSYLFEGRDTSSVKIAI